MRGLTAREREELVNSTAPTDFSPGGTDTCTGDDARVYEALVARGCVRRVDFEIDGDDYETWVVTPRGRLALLCHQAVTAGMVSA